MTLPHARNRGCLRVRGRKFVFDDGTPFVPRGLSIISVTHLAVWDELKRSSGFWTARPDSDQDLLRMNFDAMLDIRKAAAGVSRQPVETALWDNTNRRIGRA